MKSPSRTYLIITDGWREGAVEIKGTAVLRALIDSRRMGIVQLSRADAIPERVAKRLADRGMVTASWLRHEGS